MTSLYLTTTSMAAVTPGGPEVTRWKAAGSPGSSARACNKNTVTGPVTSTFPQVTDSATAGTDGNIVAWYSDPVAAVTIAGQIVASLWGVESATAANAAPCFAVYQTDSIGNLKATIVDPTVVGSQGGLEFSTTAGAKTCTVSAANVVDTALISGDRIKVALFIDDAADQGGSGTMASGRNIQLFVNGANGGSGQAQIAFTETILSAGLLGFALRPVSATRVAGYRAANW